MFNMTITICAARCCEVVLTRRGDSDQLAEFWWRRDVDGLGNQLVNPVDLGGTKSSHFLPIQLQLPAN
jgi:hypothetical protein